MSIDWTHQWLVGLTAMCLAMLATPAAPQQSFYVSADGSDDNPGTEQEPLRTVAAALQAVADGGAIEVGPGHFDLEGLSVDLSAPTSISGAGRDATTLLDPGTIRFTDSLTVRDLTFSGGEGIVLKPDSPEGNVLDGVMIERCRFEDCITAISTHKDPVGVITNVTIRDCRFERVRTGIAIIYGEISCVHVLSNTFQDIGHEEGGASCVVIGSNATRETTRDVAVQGNLMDTIFGSTEVIDGAGHEVHGILAYGTDLAIIGNTVRNLNTGQDHEAIYMKARHSVIANNLVVNCGSGAGGGDISSKGGETSMGNVICGNTVRSDEPGRGIFVNGGTVVAGNWVKKPNGFNGIDVYPLGWPATITGNHVETGFGAAIYVNGGDGGGRPYEWPEEGSVVVTDNIAICHDGIPLKLRYLADSIVSGNETGNGSPEQE
ncbi:MAG: hypothetical protein U9R79_13965 [Armatimonadota bacterium]|nr:hypothetical protein [Armatimonadota bacterium]